MKHYLVSGHLFFQDLSHRPYVGFATLQPDEAMTQDTLRTVQHLLLDEAQRISQQQGIPYPAGFRIGSFQPFETPTVAQPNTGLHLNCIDSSAMPPVDSPLIIEIQPGMLVNAKRTAHAAAKGDDLVYELQHGGLAIGRFRWTHQ